MKSNALFEIRKALAEDTVPFTRDSHKWLSPIDVQRLLLNNLGLNRSQATVRKSSGMQYLVITIHDPRVDILAVEDFAKSLDTWTMDQTDYVSGQSVNVRTTQKVDDMHRAKFLAPVADIMDELLSLPDGQGIPLELPEGRVIVFKENQGAHVYKDGKRSTSHYLAGYGLVKGLALSVARILNYHL